MNNYGSTSSVEVSSTRETMIKFLKVIISTSRANWLLIFLPIGFLAHGLKFGDTWIFVLNLLALIPFAKLFEFVIKDLSSQVEKLGSLLKVIFSNPVEIIIFMVALKDGKMLIVESLMTGIIILNLLLVSVIRKIKKFEDLMDLAYGSLVIPTAFSFDNQLLDLPYMTATILLIFIILYYYYFQLCSKELGRRGNKKQPQLSIVVSSFLLGTLVVAVIFHVQYLVDSIEGSGFNITFTNRILLPIICETKFVTVISKVFSTSGSSMKSVIFVMTLFVIVRWLMEYFQPLNIIYNSCLVAGFFILKYKIQKFKESFVSLPTTTRDVSRNVSSTVV